MNNFLKGQPIDVLMLTYNRLECVSYSISSLLQNTLHPMNVIIVDNASTDGTREYLIALKEKGLIQELILNDTNLGIAAAKNQGIEKFKWQEDFCIITDSDIAFPKMKPDWITILNETMVRHPRLGMLAPDCDEINKNVEEDQWWWDKRQFKKDDLAIIPVGFWGTMVSKEIVDAIKEKNQGELFKCRSLYGETDEQFRNSMQSIGYWVGVCLKIKTYNLGWDDKYKFPKYWMWKKQQRWIAEEARRAEEKNGK